MKISTLILILIIGIAGTTMAQASVDIDREMIEELALEGEQINSYRIIMQKQRFTLLSLSSQQWAQQRHIYEETIELLKTVLTPQQHSQFVGLISCMMDEEMGHELLAME